MSDSGVPPTLDEKSKRDIDPQENSQQRIDPTEDADPEAIENPYFANAVKSPAGTRKLPPLLDHFNAKDLKKLFKCTLAVWIQTILILINPTLRVLGQAAFLGW